GHRADPERERLREFVERFRGSEPEGLVGVQLRHEVVVIRVEPLGYFQRARCVRPSAAGTIPVARSQAARHGEAGPQIHISTGRVETLRYRTDQRAGVEYLVVKAEIVGGDEVNSGGLLSVPVGGANGSAGFEELRLVNPAGPEGFEGTFQFTLRPDARETEIMGARSFVH